MRTQVRPLLDSQDDNCNLAASQVLLIAKIFVGGKQQIESGGLGGIQQVAVP